MAEENNYLGSMDCMENFARAMDSDSQGDGYFRLTGGSIRTYLQVRCNYNIKNVF
jgi:hypothetical protein